MLNPSTGRKDLFSLWRAMEYYINDRLITLRVPKVWQGCHSICISTFPDFSMTFLCRLRRFSRPFLKAGNSHSHPSKVRKVCTINLCLLSVFKKHYQTNNIRKQRFLNINCFKFIENIFFRSLLTISFFLFFKFP